MKKCLDVIWKASTLCGSVLFAVSSLCRWINEAVFMIVGILLMMIPLICKISIGENSTVVEKMIQEEDDEKIKEIKELLEQFDDNK